MTKPAHERELTVVIPTLGRPILRHCLTALAAGSQPAVVIVVNQGRAADMRELTSEFRNAGLAIVCIQSSQTGRSAGLNTGIAEVRTPLLAITDDDCIPESDWVERMTAQLRARARTIVTGRVEAAGDDVILSVVTAKESHLQRHPRLLFDRLSGGNMGMETALARELGAFDEDPCLGTAEDAEYAYRALRAGVAIAYAPDVVVHHLAWRDANERQDQYRSYGLSQGGFYGKYLRRGDAFIALRASLHLLRAARRWAIGLLRRDRDRASFGRAYVVGLLPGIVAGWRSQGRS